ncbi:hypothetical protein SDJN03_05661, partial [Cucurbita argyrosperma subsp. sororia]
MPAVGKRTPERSSSRPAPSELETAGVITEKKQRREIARERLRRRKGEANRERGRRLNPMQSEKNHGRFRGLYSNQNRRR